MSNLRFLQQMKCKYCFGVVVIVLLLLCVLGDSNQTIPTYVIKRDFLTLLKAHGFSIYGGNETNRLYRLNSKYAFSQTIEMLDQRSNQTIAKLHSVFFTVLYRANITVFDSQTNRWIEGRIQQLFRIFFDSYTIEWNEQKIIMETTWTPYTVRFRSQTETGPIIASVHQRLISSFWQPTYDLEIFSDQLPVPVYILALVARDYQKSKSSSSSSGKSRKLKIH